ncbi:MAG: ribosomal-protein-alanine N-acetyltransferase [Halobacteriales archaeon]
MTTTASPGRPSVRIRTAERADLLGVMHIENESFPQPWPYDAFNRFLGEPGFLVAQGADGAVVGYVVSDVIPNHGGSVGHVKDLAVHPERRGQGIGRALLNRSISTMAAQGTPTVKLEVRESNDTAISLYEDFGFQSLRRIPGYYQDGEDAIVMVLDVTG